MASLLLASTGRFAVVDTGAAAAPSTATAATTSGADTDDGVDALHAQCTRQVRARPAQNTHQNPTPAATPRLPSMESAERELQSGDRDPSFGWGKSDAGVLAESLHAHGHLPPRAVPGTTASSHHHPL